MILIPVTEGLPLTTYDCSLYWRALKVRRAKNLTCVALLNMRH